MTTKTTIFHSILCRCGPGLRYLGSAITTQQRGSWISILAQSGSLVAPKVTAKASQFTRILWLELTTECYGEYSSQSLLSA